GGPLGRTSGPLAIEPPTAEITITDKVASVTQQFDAKLGGKGPAVDAVWSLDNYESGSVDAKGLYTTKGFIGGKITLTALRGDQKATAELIVKVKISEDV